jgi:hypothetical protein
MPKLTVSKESIERPEPLPEGTYVVRLDGFRPASSRDGGSVNYNPVLVVVDSVEHGTAYSGRRVFTNLNSKAGWIINEFSHAFGYPLVDDGESLALPGEFVGPDDDPSQWSYVGPLVGRTARVRVVQTQGQDGSIRNEIRQYYCSVPGCAESHRPLRS